MDTDQLSEIIAQVLKRMNIEDSIKEEKKKVLVIIEDIQNGLSNLEEHKQLLDGYDVSLLTFKNSTELGSTTNFERIFTIEDLPSSCDVWVKQFERVLVPNPSLKLVSKLAHVILDDKITEIIFSALQEKNQVLIGQALDGEKAINFTAGLRSEIQRLTDKLKDYGIQSLQTKKVTKNNYPITKDIVGKTRGVISLQDVACIEGNSNELSVSPETVITPLAMDYLREKKILIKKT